MSPASSSITRAKRRPGGWLSGQRSATLTHGTGQLTQWIHPERIIHVKRSPRDDAGFIQIPSLGVRLGEPNQ